MSNIDKRAQKELYAKVERQAHALRGNPIAYQVVTGMCPVNVIEMQAKKVQALLDELEAKDKRIAELEALARGVKQFSEFQICHYGATEDYAKGYIDCQNNYNKVLFAAAGKGEES